MGTDESAGVKDLVAIYHHALPQVYGYVLPRCGSVTVAEDVTAEAFMSAVVALERPAAPEPTVAWRQQGVAIRSDPATGVGVRLALIEDPAGNPIELFEPQNAYHERTGGQTI